MLIASTVCTAHTWLNVAPGLAYMDINRESITRWSHIHVFRINLQHYQLDLVDAMENSQPRIPIKTLANYHHALIAINGGFFDNKDRPLGLRIQNHKIINPLKPISWWGVFYMQNNKPHIASMAQYKYNHNIELAIQTGPRLLIHGRKPSLKPGLAERTALGITPKGELIMLVTENTPITTNALADLMQSINCIDAINLDGGSSSQIYAQVGMLNIHSSGFAAIHDGLIIRHSALQSPLLHNLLKY
jgi:uncharacterized protein YigE (DUF2233 family)